MPLEDTAGFRSDLLQWFARVQRDLPWRRTSDPYRIWVSEVMLQQTQVKTVIPYYQRFLDHYPTVDLLAAADITDVLKQWEGLGYYSRARNLHRAANIVVGDYDGVIPDTVNDFRKLPGVGPYIAAAVLSIAFNRPLATVDGNVKRVLARLLEISEPVNRQTSASSFQAVADRLLDRQQPGDFNQAVMELGALVCAPSNPSCGTCPVPQYCRALQKQSVADYPKRLQRKPVPVYRIAVGIVLKDQRMLITLRQPDGLLGGLWEFPGGKLESGESGEAACIREILEETGLAVGIEHPLGIIRHAYTHFRIEMAVFACRFKYGRVRLKGPAAHRWVRFEQLRRFPFPKANHKIFPLLKAYLQQRP